MQIESHGYGALSNTWLFKHGKFSAWNLLYSGIVDSQDWISKNINSQGPKSEVETIQKNKPATSKPPLHKSALSVETVWGKEWQRYPRDPKLDRHSSREDGTPKLIFLLVTWRLEWITELNPNADQIALE